jgi:hypothetical protein
MPSKIDMAGIAGYGIVRTSVAKLLFNPWVSSSDPAISISSSWDLGFAECINLNLSSIYKPKLSKERS